MEFLLWLSKNKPNQDPAELRFNPWPRSLGWGSGVTIDVSCGVDCECGSDTVLLWLWCKPVVAVPIQPLAWEFPYAESPAIKSKKKKKIFFLNLKKKNGRVYEV